MRLLVIAVKYMYVSKIIQNVFCPMERIASINAMYTVSMRRVTESTAVVFMAVNMGSNVMKVKIFDFAMLSKRVLYN